MPVPSSASARCADRWWRCAHGRFPSDGRTMTITTKGTNNGVPYQERAGLRTDVGLAEVGWAATGRLFDQQRLHVKLRVVAADEVRDCSAPIHRELLQVGALLIVAVSAFFVTRAVAANNRDMSVRDAAEWYRRGQEQIDGRKLDDAVDSFRRATVRDRGEKRYVLALARALARNRDDDAARSELLTLRESAPEDPEINLQLARLAAARQDVTEALRFYHNALYAPWPPSRRRATPGPL